MTFPVSFKVPQPCRRDIDTWLYDMGDSNFAYDWATGVISFDSKECAALFSIKFGYDRHYTTVERMYRNEVDLPTESQDKIN